MAPSSPSPVDASTVRATHAILTGAAWPGESPQVWFLPGVLAGAVGTIAGPRAGLWQLAAGGVLPIGELLKRMVRRPRPVLGRLNSAGGRSAGPSFPSTHASNYAATFGFATWILWRKRRRAALPVGIVALALVGLAGPSRVRTGDHRWSDVAAGYALGVAYLATLIGVARRDQSIMAGRNAAVGIAPPTASPGSDPGADHGR
jgi:membrane-associated phospholipid phosphatase